MRPEDKQLQKRFSTAEKGKQKAEDQHLHPVIRIQLPEIDTSTLVSDNALTLIGRLTNPQVQRMRSTISFLGQLWKLKGRARGADIGKDCFKFQFDFEEDVVSVLNQRPYFFARYMLILQRWVPSTSDDFPCEIPFWIQIQGLPLHFWQEKVLLRIGEELGKVEKHDVSSTAARIRVTINGLKPLVTETMMVYADGTESSIHLHYENLKNYCVHCNRLSHDILHCPFKTTNHDRALEAKEPAKSRRTDSEKIDRDLSKDNQKSGNPSVFRQLHWKSPNSTDTGKEYLSAHRKRSFNAVAAGHSHISGTIARQKSQSREQYSERSRLLSHPARDNLQAREHQTQRSHGPSHHRNSRDGAQALAWRAKEKQPITQSPSSPSLASVAEPSIDPIVPPPQPRTCEQIMAELKEVMVQYSSCGDPMESAARKRRLIQSEMSGLLQANAERIMELESSRVATFAKHQSQSVPDPVDSSNYDDHGGEEERQLSTKRKRGRPSLASRLASPSQVSTSKGAPRATKPRRTVRSPRAPPIRYRTTPDKEKINVAGGSSSTSKTSKSKVSRKKGLETSHNVSNVSGARDPPTIALIPPMARETTGFRKPSEEIP